MRRSAAVLVSLALAAPFSAVAAPTAPSDAVITDGATLERYGQGPGLTVVHFWASWCETCKAELPRLAKALESAQERGAHIVLVSLDDEAHARRAMKLLRLHRVPGARLRLDIADPREVTARFDRAWDAALPATFVFKDGVRTASLLGAIASPRVLLDALAN